MAICENCGKTAQVGNNVSHSKHRTKRRFKPNIQRITLYKEDGTRERKMYCTRCIKALSKV
jgi:large subunit ribosomal protein L28